MRYETISLGGNYDCETCGYTNNRIEVETEDGVEFDVLLRLGCYDGEGTIEVNAVDAIFMLEGWREYAPERVDRLIEDIGSNNLDSWEDDES